MRSLAKAACLIGTLAAIALTVSAADARSRYSARRFGGAYASVAPAPAPGTTQPGSTHYRAGGSPFPTGHGGTSASPDFQLMR